MNYFISENAFEFNSGTEFSQAARTSMYNSFGNLTLFVTRNYTPVFHRTIKTLGLNDHQVLNMYDFFQEATRVSRVKQNLRESVTIPKKRYVIESPNPDQSLILNEGRTVAKVNVMPATVALMGNVEYFDRFDHIVARDEWDYRGFKSSTAYFHPNGEVSLQKFYTPVGKVVLEITHMNVQGHLMPTMYKLINYCGANYRFNTENELFTFFMNEQLKQNPGTIILERASMLNTIQGIKSTKGKYFYLHSSHTNLKGQLLTTLVELMRGELGFTGIIVATKQQQQDMQPLTTLPVLAAPDTIVKENKTNLLANCKSHKILVLGRIAKEKQPQDALHILKSVQASVADATLEFRGYSTDRQLLNELDLLIEQLGLKNTVTFGNYVVGKMLDDVIEEAQVLLSTVPTEGNGMQNIEAMSHGLPVIAYNVNYGPNTYMSNEQLVPIGNYNQAANRIVSLFQDDKQWQEASILASQQAQLFTKDSVYKQWQDLNLQ